VVRQVAVAPQVYTECKDRGALRGEQAKKAKLGRWAAEGTREMKEKRVHLGLGEVLGCQHQVGLAAWVKQVHLANPLSDLVDQQDLVDPLDPLVTRANEVSQEDCRVMVREGDQANLGKWGNLVSMAHLVQKELVDLEASWVHAV